MTKARKSSRTKGKSVQLARQLEFDLVQVDTKTLAEARPSVQEIIPPKTSAAAAGAMTPVAPDYIEARPQSDPITDGALEHAYLQHQKDKFEDRLLKAITVLFTIMLLAICSKTGIPVSQALLESLGAPAIENAKLLSGMLGAGTIFFGGVVLYYVGRVHEHSPQLQLQLVRRPAVAALTRVLLTTGVVLLVISFFTVVYVTRWDIWYLGTWIVDHLTHVLTGWDATVQ